MGSRDNRPALQSESPSRKRTIHSCRLDSATLLNAHHSLTDGRIGGEAALYAPGPRVAPVVLALPVGVRARDASDHDYVAIDAERPRLPAEMEAGAAAFVDGIPGAVNSPCIHDAISEGAGTSSKRFAAVAAVLPSIPLTVIVLACTSIPNLDQHLNPKAYFAMADAFHVCDTAPEATDSGQRHCDGLPNPRGPKSQQHAGSFFMPGSRASQRLGSYCLA